MKPRKIRRKTLRENQGGGGGDSGVGSGSGFDFGYYGTGYYGGGMGGSYGSKADMYNIFIKPFVNVFKVGSGGLKKVARRVLTLGNVIFETVMTTLLPFLGDSYDEIFEKEAQDIERIKNEYSDVYSEIVNIVQGDAAGLAFMVSPGAVISAFFLKKSPVVAANALSVISGGISDRYIRSYMKTTKTTGRTSPRDSGIFSDSYVPNNKNVIYELKKDNLSNVHLFKKIVEKSIERSPIAGLLQRESINIYKKTLSEAEAEALSVLSARSIEEIERIVGKKLPMPPEVKEAETADKTSSEKDALQKMKESMKKFYTGPLYARVNQALGEGIPETNPFIVDHFNTIQKIEKF